MITYMKELLKATEDLEYWQILGIVELEIIDDMNCKIKGESDSKTYHKQPEDYKTIDHEYIWQTTGICEDDFSGYLLFPLKNGKYLKCNYQC